MGRMVRERANGWKWASCCGLRQKKSANGRAREGDGVAWRPRSARHLSAVGHDRILKTVAPSSEPGKLAWQSDIARSLLLNRCELAKAVVDKVVALHVNSNFALDH
jgi:hypothetical protein